MKALFPLQVMVTSEIKVLQRKSGGQKHWSKAPLTITYLKICLKWGCPRVDISKQKVLYRAGPLNRVRHGVVSPKTTPAECAGKVRERGPEVGVGSTSRPLVRASGSTGNEARGSKRPRSHAGQDHRNGSVIIVRLAVGHFSRRRNIR